MNILADSGYAKVQTAFENLIKFCDHGQSQITRYIDEPQQSKEAN